MRINEFQRANPIHAPQQPSMQNIGGMSFGEHVKNLVKKEQLLPTDDPKKEAISKFLSIVDRMISVTTDDSVQEETSTKRVIKPSGAPSNVSYVRNANAAYLNEWIKTIGNKFPGKQFTAQELMELAATMDLELQVSSSPAVKKAVTSAIKGIQLNTKGEIGALDADIEAMANEFVKRFGVKLIWARNIVGMFGQSIDRKDRQRFLQACLKGEALDINKMITMGEGSIDEVVTTIIPKVKDVFKSVKDTLLDISLSTGQRGATGPFEALLAIMGGARKPAAGEGGDIKLQDDRKFEVKSTSLTPSSKLKKDGTLPGTGGNTTAWLDSTAGGELSGSVLRSYGTEFLSNLKIRNSNFMQYWKASDFRRDGLENFNKVLEIINKSNRTNGAKLIYAMMSKSFPSIANVKGYNFLKDIIAIETAIRKREPREIAKIQGIMALLEYHVGKGNDGFIFFNSSTQEFKIFEGIEGIMKLASDSGNVHFTSPMTMGKSQKCSPGIYYGPEPTSPKAKEYFEKYNSDPERVKRYVKAQQEKQRDLENSKGFD